MGAGKDPGEGELDEQQVRVRASRMRLTYEVRSGKRVVALRDGETASDALLDYARSLGCREDELTRLGSDAISWRGAIFRAAPLSSDDVEGRQSGRSQ